MPTWHILSDTGNGNNIRWELCSTTTEHGEYPTRIPNTGSPLPSMAQLLLQGFSELNESQTGNEASESVPMFRTGFGKSVSIKHSSIAKARSLLGGEDSIVDTGESRGRDKNSCCSSSNSLFQTASGKLVKVSSVGLVRAKALLGLEEDRKLGVQHVDKRSSTYNGELDGWESSLHTENSDGVTTDFAMKPPSHSSHSFIGCETKSDNLFQIQLKMGEKYIKPPLIKFHTAGGRSLSVSSDALQRARNLLGGPDSGDLLKEGSGSSPLFSFLGRQDMGDTPSNKENSPCFSFLHHESAQSKGVSTTFISPLRSSFNQEHVRDMADKNALASNLMDKFDEAENKAIEGLISNSCCIPKPRRLKSCAPTALPHNLLTNDSKISPYKKLSGGPLVDISNNNSLPLPNSKQFPGEKKRVGTRTSISPFKRPRSSNFSTPLKGNIPHNPHGLSSLSSESPCKRRRVSTKYPFQVSRMYVKEYLGTFPPMCDMLEMLPPIVRMMRPDDAENHIFYDEAGAYCIGAEAFYNMLVKSGASVNYIPKGWVENHYKWVVWKLACYERCYPAKCAGKFLTISNVLEEIKYRYEREVNHGHRSSVKRILEGDASASSMMVLCISAIHSKGDLQTETTNMTARGNSTFGAAKVELTDGWYSMDALLDVLLSKQLAAGKLFVGQKLRIWGARLCGWDGPVSPLEASRTINLLLHINGTYRAHWADRLGFCKGVGAPLAFSCIKSNGGPVPCTLVGVSRIYSVLYMERFSNGKSIVRSETMENKISQLFNQRRIDVIEGVTSDFQREFKGSELCSDSSEGAKISKILEAAAEPEILMAEMSPEQLASFTAYRSKLEAFRQSDKDKLIKKALEDAGLKEREVTQFMRVRVVGLISKNCQGKRSYKQGFITLWNPTERQQSELVEGKAYSVGGLVPMNSDSGTLCLQARGSSTDWRPLSPSAVEQYKPFFSPRNSITLLDLDYIPLSSEFDVVALVIYVGEVYIASNQKRQWVFVTDSSTSHPNSEYLSSSFLAINFFSPRIDGDSFAFINCNLAGSVVGFCNLINKTKDQMNHLWVADATENSTYSLDFGSPQYSHLKSAAATVKKWAMTSGSIVDKLREKVFCIVSNS